MTHTTTTTTSTSTITPGHTAVRRRAAEKNGFEWAVLATKVLGGIINVCFTATAFTKLIAIFFFFLFFLFTCPTLTVTAGV